MNIVLIIVTVVHFLLVSSCSNLSKQGPQDEFDQFPLGVGCQWKYASYDSLRGVHDTIIVTSINNERKPDGSEVYLWKYEYTSKSESLFIHRRGDTVRFLPIPTGEQKPGEFRFPLVTGRQWDVGPGFQARIVGTDSVSVPAGRFDTSYVIVIESKIPNDLSRFQVWIAPGVGIVKERRMTAHTTGGDLIADLRPVIQTWRLLSYSIPD